MALCAALGVLVLGALGLAGVAFPAGAAARPLRVFDRARHRLGLRLATGRRLSQLPGSSVGDPTGRTIDQGPSTIDPPFGHRTVDHVLVSGFAGRCHVRRIDGGGGMDHRAQVCRLRLHG